MLNPDRFRFRVNWRGKLILQTYVEQTVCCSHGQGLDRNHFTWRDASPEDLLILSNLTKQETT